MRASIFGLLFLNCPKLRRVGRNESYDIPKEIYLIGTIIYFKVPRLGFFSKENKKTKT